jgi:hypothetical protein
MSFPQIDADGNILLAKRRCAATLSVAAADVFSAKNGQQTLCATAHCHTLLRNVGVEPAIDNV